MFGLFMIIGNICTKICSVIKISHENKESRKRAILSGKETYTDAFGTTRHTNNNQPYMYSHLYANGDGLGDLYEINPYTHKPIKNITEINRRENEKNGIKYAVEQNMDYYSFENNDWHLTDKIRGPRYKSLNKNNNHVYVVRRYLNVNWLVNIETALAEDWDKLDLEYTRLWCEQNGVKPCIEIIDNGTGYKIDVEITEANLLQAMEDANRKQPWLIKWSNGGRTWDRNAAKCLTTMDVLRQRFN